MQLFYTVLQLASTYQSNSFVAQKVWVFLCLLFGQIHSTLRIYTHLPHNNYCTYTRILKFCLCIVCIILDSSQEGKAFNSLLDSQYPALPPTPNHLISKRKANSLLREFNNKCNITNTDICFTIIHAKKYLLRTGFKRSLHNKTISLNYKI